MQQAGQHRRAADAEAERDGGEDAADAFGDALRQEQHQPRAQHSPAVKRKNRKQIPEQQEQVGQKQPPVDARRGEQQEQAGQRPAATSSRA